MKWILALLLFAWLPASAAAKDASPTYELTVNGTLEIGPDGVVRSYELNPPPKPVVAALVKKAVDHWRFVPIFDTGKPVIARTQMMLFLEAVPAGDAYSVKITGIIFGQPFRTTYAPVPHYPHLPGQAELGARVMLVLRIDPEGKVVNTDVFQTSLDGHARNYYSAAYLRHLFEREATDTLRKWRFDPAAFTGARSRGAIVHVPVVFGMNDSNQDWKGFIPGPIHPIPWLPASAPTHVAESRLRNGEAVALDSRFKLENDVIGKTL